MVECQVCSRVFTPAETCPFCDQVLCGDHRHPDDHDCAYAPDLEDSSAAVPKQSGGRAGTDDSPTVRADGSLATPSAPTTGHNNPISPIRWLATIWYKARAMLLLPFWFLWDYRYPLVAFTLVAAAVAIAL